MRLNHSLFAFTIAGRAMATRARKAVISLALACASGFTTETLAAPYVEFDFAPFAACRDVTPASPSIQSGGLRLIEVALPISVRFHGVTMDVVDELAIEISGAAAGLRVHDFAPATQLTSDVTNEIETVTTTKQSRSLDGSLGGALPVPLGEVVAHVTPSINAGISGSETATEKINRLPPMYASVVSGTSLEGRGVFFKLKRTSQTSLEGVHEFAVTFVAPPQMQRAELQISCSARGQRKVLWMKQSTTLGEEQGSVKLALVRTLPPRQLVLKPVSDAKAPVRNTWRPTRPEKAPSKTREEIEAAKEHEHPTHGIGKTDI
jgi:hypothetical protein